MSLKCKVTDCESKQIHLRGLCRQCYTYAASLVFHELATWTQLEIAGCVEPTTGQIQSPKRPERTKWFARAVGFTPDQLTQELRERHKKYVNKNKQTKAHAYPK